MLIDLDSWTLYMVGWQARSLLDQGEWDRAADCATADAWAAALDPRLFNVWTSRQPNRRQPSATMPASLERVSGPPTPRGRHACDRLRPDPISFGRRAQVDDCSPGRASNHVPGSGRTVTMSRLAKRRSLACSLLALALQAIAGCVATGTRTAPTELHRDYDAGAIPRLRARAAASPRDANRQRELGVAYYDIAVADSSARQAASDSALQALWKARELSNQDARTLFYIGATHELRGELREAMDAYRLYAGARGDRGDRLAMEKRFPDE